MKLNLPRISLTMPTLILVSAVYFGTVMNYPVLKALFGLSQNVQDSLFFYSAPLLLISAFLIIFSLFAWRYVFKPFMVFVLLTSAAALYAEVNFHTLFDMTMMESVFETNSSEISFYTNMTSTLYLLGFGLIPSLLLMMVKIKPQRSWKIALASRLCIVVIGACGVSAVAATQYKNYASVGRNNKYLNRMIIPGHIYSGVRYLNKLYFTTTLPYKSQGTDATLEATQNGKPTLMVIVLGETARAMNFIDNGYGRNTQPYTQSLGLISFEHVSSCGTYTALSVPCMFSNMNRTDYNKERAMTQDNVLNVMQHAGVKVLWIDNDGGSKGVANNLPNQSIDTSLKDQDCNGSTCFDEIMLKKAQTFIHQDKQNKVLVLHTIGSHGPTYFQRYPTAYAPFQPACNRSDIENCSDQEIKNVYDNTLVYTDFVLSQVIQELKGLSSQYNVMMTYISDHGESLGENGLYLHGTPYSIAPKEQTHVPWLLWMPKQYAEQKHLNIQCLQNVAKQASLSHDNLFHSLLGLYGISTQVDDTKLDITHGCKQAS